MAGWATGWPATTCGRISVVLPSGRVTGSEQGMAAMGRSERIEHKLDTLIEKVSDLSVNVGKLQVSMDNIHSHYASKDDVSGLRADLKWIKWLLGAAVAAIAAVVARAWILDVPLFG